MSCLSVIGFILLSRFIVYFADTVIKTNLLVSFPEIPLDCHPEYTKEKDGSASPIIGVEDLDLFSFKNEQGQSFEYLFGTADRFRKHYQDPIIGIRSIPTSQKIQQLQGNGTLFFRLKEVGSDDSIFSKLEIEESGPKYFHPHGLGLLQSYKNQTKQEKKSSPEFPSLIYVINHAPFGDEVVIFEIIYESLNTNEYPSLKIPKKLKTKSIVSHSTFKNLNDVAPVSENEFYATNWIYYEQGSAWSSLEILGKYAWNDVVHCKRDFNIFFWDCQVLSDLKQPNGINFFDDQNELIFIEGLEKKIKIYYRHPISPHTLILKQELHTNSVCDNIARNGNLIFIGCHLYPLSFAKYSRDIHKNSDLDISEISSSSTSEILKLSKTTKGHYRLETIFLGNSIKGSSVAMPLEKGKEMVVGTVFEKGLYFCKI